MKRTWLIWTIVAIVAIFLSRSSVGLWFGNQARVVSDKLVLYTLQSTSDFEKDAQK